MYHSKVPFISDFHLSITISTWDTSLGPFSSQFWVDDVTRLGQNFKILRALFHKGKTHLKSTFHFWFSSIYQHWYIKYQFGPFWEIFRLMTSQQSVKTSKFWDSGFNRNTLPQFIFTIAFHLSVTIGTWKTSLDPFWPSFGLMRSPGESNLPFSEKEISETNL